MKVVTQAVAGALTPREKLIFLSGTILAILSAVGFITARIYRQGVWVPIAGGIYSEGFIGQPVDSNPVTAQSLSDKALSVMLYSSISDLAETIETKDFKNFQIKLRDGLEWADGEPITTDDLIFTLDSIKNPAARSPLLSAWQNVEVERVSALHLSVNLPEPYAWFSEILKNTRPIPHHVYESVAPENFHLSAYRLEPIGSGPYQVSEIRQLLSGFVREIKLTRNNNYWGKEALIPDFRFRFYTNQEKLSDALRRREILGFLNLEPNPDPTTSRGLKTTIIPSARVTTVFLNSTNNPKLSSASIRKALSAGSNRASFKEIFGSEVELSTSPLPPSLGGPEVNLEHSIQPELNGLSLNLLVPQSKFWEKTASSLREAWLGAGAAEINILNVSPDVLNSRLLAGNYEAALFGLAPDYIYDLFPFWHSRERLDGKNVAGYADPETDKILEMARRTGDENSSVQVANRLTGGQGAIFLMTLPFVHTHTEKLSGLNLSAASRVEEIYSTAANWSVLKARVLLDAGQTAGYNIVN
jgi:peptide/nickel transport system substrate-binding protein